MTIRDHGTIFWSSSLEASYGSTPIKAYPGGEPLVGFPGCRRIDKILVRPTSMLSLMGAMFFVDAVRERGWSSHMELVLPFVPGARQDRLNDAGDFLCTAKSVAKEINLRGFHRVTVIDPHSEVIAALIDRCDVVHADECIRLSDSTMVRYSAVVSPDAGAEKRALGVARMLGVPMLHGWKTRDVSTGAIAGFGLEPSDVTGRVLVVDDICDGGGTFLGLSDVLRTRGLEADLYVTHGIFSQGTTKLLERYGKVFCTDSIDVPCNGVGVLRICGHFMKGIDQ